MNAETRAKEVIDKLCFCDSELRRLIGHEGIVYIAAAITRAENDKLEEAAAAYDEVHAERGLGVRGQPNLFSMWLRRWAQYQSLKSKDTP